MYFMLSFLSLISSLLLRNMNCLFQASKAKIEKKTKCIRDCNDIITMKKNATSIFYELDKNENGLLEAYELYTSLIDTGILVSIDIVTTLFNHINRNSDGFLSLNEFISYMIKPHGTITQETFKSLFFNIDVIWLSSLLSFMGGVFFAIGGFATEQPLVNHQANFYLAGSILYTFTSFRNVAFYKT